MCLQDLAIDRRVTVRTTIHTSTVQIGLGVFVVLPASPSRLWCLIYDSSSGDPVAIRVRVMPAIVAALPNETGGVGDCSYASIDRYPGIFLSELYATGAVASVVMVAGYYDTDLDKAIQRENESISMIARN